MTKQEMIFKIVEWVIMAGIFLYTQIRAHIYNKKVKNLTTKLDKNKESQKEEENKDMANFLCDKCGKKVSVENAHSVTLNCKHYDLCEQCYVKVTNLMGECNTAAVELEKARQNYERASAALKLEEPHPADDTTESSEDETAAPKTLEKLGLKK